MHSRKILLFEDSPDILSVASTILSSHYNFQGYAECPADVCEIVVSHKPDIILMDLDIPDIGGEQATKLLQENPQTANIPVIIFSACSDAEKIA
jgi:CheY-like chemotaxis protein